MDDACDFFIFVGPTSGGTWVVGDHERFLTDSPCHASGVTYALAQDTQRPDGRIRRVADNHPFGGENFPPAS